MGVTGVLGARRKAQKEHLGVEKGGTEMEQSCVLHTCAVCVQQKQETEAEEWSDSAHPLFCSGSRCPGEKLRWEVGILGLLYCLWCEHLPTLTRTLGCKGHCFHSFRYKPVASPGVSKTNTIVPNSVQGKYKLCWPSWEVDIPQHVLPKASSRVILMTLGFCFMPCMEPNILDRESPLTKRTLRRNSSQFCTLTRSSQRASAESTYKLEFWLE